MLEGVRCLQLPLLCERIVEIPVRDWLVTPALRKDGSYCVRKAPILDDTSSGPDKGDLKPFDRAPHCFIFGFEHSLHVKLYY